VPYGRRRLSFRTALPGAAPGATARAAAALRLALLAAGLVHGRGGDALRDASAAAAALRRPLDLLVLPLALVAPGLRHPDLLLRRNDALSQSARKLCIGLLGRKGEKQRQQLDHRGELVERHGAAEPIVPGTRERVPTALPAPNTTAENIVIE